MLTLTKDIRVIDTVVPIILLTAKSQTKDVIAGFEVGCNDYIRKLFSIEELIVRVYALLNEPRKAGSMDREVSIGAYLFSADRQTLKFANHVFSLMHREFSLLQLLIEHRNEVVNRIDILQKIWNNDDFFAGRSMDVFITKLRKKLLMDKSISILNVRGIGFKIVF